MKIGDTLLTGPGPFFITLKGGIGYSLKDSAFDLNGDSLMISWLLTQTSQLVLSGAFYNSPEKITKDTLVLSVSDGDLMTKKKIIISIINVAPIFDSLKVDSLVFKGSDSLFSYKAFVGDTLNLAIYARDLDPTVDTLKYFWNAGNSAAFISKSQWRAKYKCPLKVTVDTITSLLIDGPDTIKKTIRVNIGARAPVIDSLKIDSTTFKGTRNVFSDTASAGDTVEFRAFGHDNDRQDQIDFRWKALNSTQLVAQATPNKIKYICKSISYFDTISVTALDNYGNTAIKAVELIIEKK
jgi:hypothetical protein